MPSKKIDIVGEVLDDCVMAYPVSSFIISLYKQYQLKGSLSKRQLQGLFGKASKIAAYSSSKLATLEAVIKKMPTKYKSDKPETTHSNNCELEKERKQIDEILQIFPNHKRVHFLRMRLDNNFPLTTSDRKELDQFFLLAQKKRQQ